jgi:hypothetical protein
MQQQQRQYHIERNDKDRYNNGITPLAQSTSTELQLLKSSTLQSYDRTYDQG